MAARSVDRRAVEAALPVSLAEALPELCALWGVRPDRWDRIPALSAFLVGSAARAEIDARMRRGVSETAAIGVVAGRLGIPAATLRTSIQEARRRVMTGLKSKPRGRSDRVS